MTVITDDTVDLIKRWEGLRLDAYRDQAGIWTIGYGHSANAPLPPKPAVGMQITEDEAEAILRADLEHFAEKLRPMVPEDLPANVFGACLSLAFNIGLGAFQGSTCRRRLEAGDTRGAAEALTWWNKVTVGGKKVVSKGLVNRRASEKAYMLRQAQSPVVVPPAVTEEPDAPVAEPPAKPWYASTTVWGGIIALVAGAGAFGDVVLTEGDASTIAEIAAEYGLATATAIGGVMAVIGRIKATKQIGAAK